MKPFLTLGLVLASISCGKIGYDPDAGHPPDASVPPDAWASLDASAPLDAWVSPDVWVPNDVGTDAPEVDRCADWTASLGVCTSPPDDPTLFERNYDIRCGPENRRAPADECYAEWAALVECRGGEMYRTCDFEGSYAACMTLEVALQCCDWPRTCGSV